MRFFIIETRSGTWIPVGRASAFELRREWVRRHPALDWVISTRPGRGLRLDQGGRFALGRARDELYGELAGTE